MADAEKLVESLPDRDDVTYIGLIMNQRGFERARDCGIDEVGMVIVSTDTYNMKNQNVVTQQSIDNWLDIASSAKSAGIRTSVVIACSFGCPYEGEVDPEHIASIAEQILKGEPDVLGLADSVGVAVPNQIKTTAGKASNCSLEIETANADDSGIPFVSNPPRSKPMESKRTLHPNADKSRLPLLT